MKWEMTKPRGDERLVATQTRVRPLDPSAQDIRFELNLPTNWNRKAVQYGGGAFDGWFGDTNGLDRTPVSVATEPGPLARGFSTFGGDSGHHKHYFLLPDALNLVHFIRPQPRGAPQLRAGRAKKDARWGVAIMERRYCSRPARMFFLGGSTGGREAYFVVQGWPEESHAEFFYAFAERADFANDILAGRERKRGIAWVQAASHQNIGECDARRQYAGSGKSSSTNLRTSGPPLTLTTTARSSR